MPKVLICNVLLRHGNILKLPICDTSKAWQRECHPPCFGWRQMRAHFPKMIRVYMSTWVIEQIHGCCVKFSNSSTHLAYIWTYGKFICWYKQIHITFLMFTLKTGGGNYQQDVGTSVVEFCVGTWGTLSVWYEGQHCTIYLLYQLYHNRFVYFLSCVHICIHSIYYTHDFCKLCFHCFQAVQAPAPAGISVESMSLMWSDGHGWIQGWTTTRNVRQWETVEGCLSKI